MNNEMAYLLGMISGNGEIKRDSINTTISIEIPHKVIKTDEFHDIPLYVRASISNIRNILEPLIGNGISFSQEERATILFFSKPNTEYLIREILRYTGSATTHANMRIHEDIFNFTYDERKQFIKGFCDTTAYIRRSNTERGIEYMHRVYIEIPQNWYMVVDICNLLKSIDVPVQNIDWAHPNIRDGNLTKYNQGYHNFWKKEHQIKIYANEFKIIGFGIEHKNIALENYVKEMETAFLSEGKDIKEKTHKYFWDTRIINRNKPSHPGENDNFIPEEIRGNHYNSWKQIAKDLGYDK
ncbi:hypothetical protein [Candidatus Ruminimicrobiellum ovillum]|uniref:hypothetical protein n=1 Tax=Candidatus Ruminimicrobiellum ovillum TaxID=1947927 RepID=UPI00354DF683|nr:hypothetical protein [Elusimicrobiota bacterium]